jgi:hypothetical protein
METTDKAKLRFELAIKNLDSIGRAQTIYVTSLLIYQCLVWIMFFPASHVTLVHFAWLELNKENVWPATPVIILVLKLALIGNLNATLSAYREVRKSGSDIFGIDFGTFFAVDAHKNLIDYFALLQVPPWSTTRVPSDSTDTDPWWRRLHNLLYPGLFTVCLFTSYWAVHEMTVSGGPKWPRLLGWTCFGLQSLFSLRPLTRWFGRLFGARRESFVWN